MSVLAGVRPTFRALAASIVPEAAALGPEGWAELERIVDAALARRPAAVRRQLLVFIRALDILPLFRWGRTFRRLDPDRRRRFLQGVQDAPVLLARRGFWGLRTLVFMGYYARPEAYDAVGYQARLRGWVEHPDAPAAARAAAAAEASQGSGRAPGGDAEPGGGGLAGHAPAPLE
ncbi:MAG TPA: hypothetical protein VMM12_04465 [Longimicrobiales bacterium]|nr:hypothetical protein [Longimicrobiales bacterium]